MFTSKLSKSLIITLSITGLLVILNSCNNIKNQEVDKLNKIIEKLQNELKEKEQLKIDPPIGLISVDTAKKWEAAYVDSIDEELVRNLNYTFNREFFIPLDRMKNYIEYYQQYADSVNLKNLGLRVYVSVRPPNKDKAEIGKKGVQTIFIAPTATNAKEVDGAKQLIEQNENVYTFKAMNLFGSGNKPY